MALDLDYRVRLALRDSLAAEDFQALLVPGDRLVDPAGPELRAGLVGIIIVPAFTCSNSLTRHCFYLVIISFYVYRL